MITLFQICVCFKNYKLDFSFDVLFHGVKNSISLSVSSGGVCLVGDVLPNCALLAPLAVL